MKNYVPDYLSNDFNFDDPNLISVIDELPLWSAPFGLTLLDTVIIRKNLNVLDIGFGNGFPLIEIAQRFGSSCNIFGVDPWDKVFERVEMKIKFYGMTNVTIMNAKAEELPFDTNYFDLIVSNNGINNVENPELALSECSRVAKPNAQMVLTMNLPDTMITFYNIFIDLLKEQKKIVSIEKLKEHIFKKRKPVEYLRTLIQSNDFEIKQEILKSFNMKFVDGTAFFNHFLIRIGFMESWKEIVEIDDRNVSFNLLEKRLNDFSDENAGLELEIPYVCFDCLKK